MAVSFTYCLIPQNNDLGITAPSYLPCAGLVPGMNPYRIAFGQQLQVTNGNDAFINSCSFPYLNQGVDPIVAATSSDYFQQRGARIFKAVRTNVDATVWTPSFAGAKVCVMGGVISVAATLAVAGTLTIDLKDDTAVFFSVNATVGATPITDSQIPFDLGQGYVSTTAGNLITVDLGGALASGSICVNLWGIEIG